MTHWALRLSGARPPGPELKWLGPDGARVRQELGEGAVSWALDVGAAIAAKISKEIPQLAADISQFGLLRRATTSTTLRALTIAAGVGESDATLASTEVIEIAHDFARRGLELGDLLRSIRVGYVVLATALLDAATEPHQDNTAELRRISVLLFELMDDFTGVAASAFLDEQRAWEADISAARLDIVRTLVDGEPVDTTHAERILNYPLAAHHVGVIASRANPRSYDRLDLRGVVGPVLRHWGSPTSTLIVPVGAHSLWAWAAFNHAPQRDGPGLPRFDQITVGIGQPGNGVEGFRRTHFEALAVERLRALSGAPRPTSIAHHEIDLEALLLADADAARHFAERYLGPLAASDPRTGELRSTLRFYLDSDHSLAKVAATKHISRNTVTYRVQQALTMCEHGAGESTAKLRNALAIAHWLDNATSKPSVADPAP